MTCITPDRLCDQRVTVRGFGLKVSKGVGAYGSRSLNIGWVSRAWLFLRQMPKVILQKHALKKQTKNKQKIRDS